MIKRIIGRPIGSEDNLQRERFNEKLRTAYRQEGTLFDLAQAEATSPLGKIATFTINGEPGIYLNPAYTYDGGHLNELGRVTVAGQFLTFLAMLSEKMS